MNETALKHRLNLHPSLFHIPLLAILLLGSACGSKWTAEEKDGFHLILNEGGQTLSYTPTSGVSILEDKAYAFKDLNRNGKLDPYEDWRLSVDERAEDLAGRLSVEQLSGLMLTATFQTIPASDGFFAVSTFNGKPFAESGAEPSDLSDQQQEMFVENQVRHMTLSRLESPVVAARWNNKVQALVEGLGLGIPLNTFSDPRHGTTANAEFNAGAGGDISMWPTELGLAASFDPELVRDFGHIASTEYRALGIASALSPQIDLATDPRWFRFNGTFGEDPILAKEMARAYADGFQTSVGEDEIRNGWGYTSVNAMAKHWPGGGSGEGGRDAHYAYGKYAVYPGANFKEHLIPFTEGAFKLDGPTKMVSAIMPYYTISQHMDTVYGENVGNGFSQYIINDLLRGKYGYDGVLCTDFGIVKNNKAIDQFGAPNWGAEHLSVAERHYKVILAGLDQFGGSSEIAPVLEAYKLGVEEHGEKFMHDRYVQSAIRVLKNTFRVGLFENPYLDLKKSDETAGHPEFIKAGFNAQIKSIVMLKNAGSTLPVSENATVYVPKKFYPASRGRFGFGGLTEARWDYPLSLDIIKKYLRLTDKPEEADVALVLIDSPDGGNGYTAKDVAAGGNGYLPITLQYKEYLAEHAREVSIAGGDPREDFTNRSYKGKKATASNTRDLDVVLDTRKAMKDKPVIVVVNVSKPMVFAEFENAVDAILLSFSVQGQAIMEIVTGRREPSGLLPMQMPATMKTVEEQHEDVPRDMECYTDLEGNTYDFAFGLNWRGVINDARVQKYR